MTDPVFAMLGLFLVVLGSAIWRFKLVQIIAGFDPQKVKDIAGLARWVGINLVLMGAILLALIFGGRILARGVPVWLHVAIILGLSFRTARGCRYYEQ